jgi:DMSO/TMAO reductase YedYZ molybdopterin-dependent catalytic subunit
MNANMNLKLELNAETLKAMLPLLKKAQPVIYGLLLIGVFGYTAYVVNQSLNVQAAEGTAGVKPLPKITFDQKTITAVKALNKVAGEVPLGNLGANDPFK